MWSVAVRNWTRNRCQGVGKRITLGIRDYEIWKDESLRNAGSLASPETADTIKPELMDLRFKFEARSPTMWPEHDPVSKRERRVDGNLWRKLRSLGQYMSTAAVQASETSSEGIIITDSCVKRLKEIQIQEGPDGQKKMLRLSVDGGGCSGFLYTFSLDDNHNPDDRLFERDGVKVVVDDVSFSFVKGATIDFSEELIRASFTVAINPNAASGCGCGASFTAK